MADRDPRVTPMAGDVLRGESGTYRLVAAVRSGLVFWHWSLGAASRDSPMESASLVDWRNRWARNAEVITMGEGGEG